MKKVILALILFPTSLLAELPYIPSCIIQDSLDIEDLGNDKAIVTYYNSVEGCSSPAEVILTAPNGIAVNIKIVIGGEENDYRELIYLTPLDPNFMSLPPEEKLLDGEKMEFVIQGGLS